MITIEIYKDRNDNYYVQAGDYKVRIADRTRPDGTTIGHFELVKKLTIPAVSRRLFLVTFLGKDERGEIVKGIEVIADSSEDAMNLIKEVSMSREIYSAIDV